jgi:hypothetical protein
MTLSLSTLPLYVAVGEPCALLGSSDAAADEDTQWELTAVPVGSRLALGQIVERHPMTVRVNLERFTFVPATSAPVAPAAITRSQGSFIAAGFTVGMTVDISGSASNNKRVTLDAVTAERLTLGLLDDLTTETATASLLGADYGAGGAPSNIITFDVPGEYAVLATERFTAQAMPSFAGHPFAAPQSRVLSTASTTIYVGAYAELPIVPVNGHAVTLRLLVVNDTVRRAELVRPATELARVATLDPTVAAAVAALEGVAVNSLDVEFVADVNTLCEKIAAHFLATTESSGVHAYADTTNTILREKAYSVPAALARLNEASTRLTSHREATLAGGTWHAGGDDTKNTLQVAPTATTLGEAIVLKADLRERSYERHRVTVSLPAAHAAPDVTNSMAAPLALPSAIVAYLDFIANNTPSAVAGESEGIADIQAALGFRTA